MPGLNFMSVFYLVPTFKLSKSETYSEPCQTYEMERFTKIVDG